VILRGERQNQGAFARTWNRSGSTNLRDPGERFRCGGDGNPYLMVSAARIAALSGIYLHRERPQRTRQEKRVESVAQSSGEDLELGTIHSQSWVTGKGYAY
jgi:hypothetical protein